MTKRRLVFGVIVAGVTVFLLMGLFQHDNLAFTEMHRRNSCDMLYTEQSALSVRTAKDFNSFTLDDDDVFIFLHIQKTGGTVFEKNLVHHLQMRNPCKCRKPEHCVCLTPKNTSWIVGRFSGGWPCNTHNDWTELEECLDAKLQRLEKQKLLTKHRRVRYITILREPVERFLSEWRHVHAGHTWYDRNLRCRNKNTKIPFCWKGGPLDNWKDVTLDEFLNCKDNLVKNRQTRMLADLRLIDCYNNINEKNKTRDDIMLQSAKDNLLKVPFFGLTNYQKLSQLLFEQTFNVKFDNVFTQNSNTAASKALYTQAQLDRIKEQSNLDIELYEYAEKIFLHRVRQMIQQLYS